MKDHFRLRSRKELRVAEDVETRMQLRVIHGVAFFSVLLASFAVGFTLWNASKLPTNVQGAVVQQNEKTPTRTYDKFRGYKKVKGEALGYFSLQRTDSGKWSLITPEGNAFFGMAVNKVWPWNIEEDAYRTKFQNSNTLWAMSATALLDSLRFNTLGNNAQLDMLIQDRVLRFPYTLTGDDVKWESGERAQENDYPDVWSEDFINDADLNARKMSQKYVGDPYVLLKWTGNELHLNLQTVSGTADPASIWWKSLVKEEGQTPAKEVWVGLYKTRYNNDIAEVNKVYGTAMTSFDDMYTLGFGLYSRFVTIEEGEEADAQKAYQDIDDWSTEIGRQFHKVVYEASKTYMPNVIVTSERLVQANHSPLYFEKIKPYIDALAFNMYLSTEQVTPSEETLDRYAAMVDHKPLIISEHSFLQEPCNVSDDGGTYPGVPTQADRAIAHKAYRDPVLEHPSVAYLGFHEYTDVFSKDNTCGYTNFGLVSRQADPYQEMIDAGLATWQNFDELRWKTELLVDTSKGFQQPNVITNTNTAKSNEPITNVNGAANRPTNTNTAFRPITNTNTASNFQTNTNSVFNPKKDTDQLLKPIVGVTSGSNFKTDTDTGANRETDTEVGANPITQTDVARNLPDNTDGVADLVPNGSTLAGFFTAQAAANTNPTIKK